MIQNGLQGRTGVDVVIYRRFECHNLSVTKSRFRKYLRPSLILLAIGIVSSLLLAAYHFVRVQNRLAVWQDMAYLRIDFSFETLEEEIYNDETFWIHESRGGDVLGDIVGLNIEASEIGLGFLEHLPNLQTLTLYASDEHIVSADTLKMIRHRYVNLDDFALANAELDNAGQRELAAFAGLTHLALHNVNVTDDDLIKLLRQSRLTTLLITNCPDITDRSLEALKSQTALNQLSLDGCHGVTDKGLKWCADLSELTLLDLSRTNVTGEGLRWVSDLKSLIWLKLGNIEMDSDAIEHLLGLTSLTSLDLEGTLIDDRAVERLDVLSIEDLYLEGTQISDDALKHLANWPKLGCLSVDETGVSDRGLQYLEASNSLYNFYCDGTYATPGAARRLISSREIASETINISSWENADRFNTATGKLVGGFPGIPDAMSMSGVAVFPSAGAFELEAAHLRRMDVSPAQRIPGQFGESAISPDGSTMALGYTGMISILDTKEMRPLKKLATKGFVRDLCFWNSERLAATLYGDHVIVWDVRTARKICATTSGCADECRFSADGDRLLVWNDSAGAELIDVASGNAIQAFPDALVAAFLPSGDLIWVPRSVESNGTFVLRSGTDERELWSCSSDSVAVLFSADGSLVAVGNEFEREIAIFDTVDGTRRCTIPTNGDTLAHYSLYFTPDNQQLLYSRGLHAIYDLN